MKPQDQIMALSTADEIKGHYVGARMAEGYVSQRFESQLNLLLHERQVAVVQGVIDRAKPARVLEIAPGPGRVTRDIRTDGEMVCLEYNAGMIGEGRAASGGRVSWVRGDGFRVPFSGGFDLVYSFRFIRHFRRPDRERLYAEIRRVLNPGGFFVMDAVNERLSRSMREAKPDHFPVYDELHRPEELREELATAGLEPQELVPVQKWYNWQYRSQVIIGPRSEWLNRRIIRGLERLPRRDGLEWIATCRRA